MAIVDYAGFVTECLVEDGFPARRDGWMLKHTDNGKQYLRVSGQWVNMEMGLSFAPPTKSGSVVTGTDGTASIVFGTPFVDNAYTVALTCSDNGNQPIIAVLVSKTKNGFSIITRSTRSGQATSNITVSWLATRNYNA